MSVGNEIKLSIITASYHDLEGLTETSNSVLRQTIPVEWIVIDGDSGIEVRQFLTNLNPGPHIFKWVSESDLGLYHAMNKGFELSTGGILQFLNCGDTLADDTLVAKILDSHNDENWNWGIGLALRFNESGVPHSVWEYLQPQLVGLALGTRTFCHQAIFYTREILEKVMPYDNSNLAADHLLNIKAFKISKPKMLPFVTTYFRDGGISSQRPFGAAMKDLRRIRIEENLLLGGSKVMDYIISSIVVRSINISGLVSRINNLIMQTARLNKQVKRLPLIAQRARKEM